MLPLSINPLPALITLTAAFSVLVHDSQIDFATMTAMAVPAAIVTGDIVGLNLLGASQHIHAERGSFNSRTVGNNQAATPPRNENDKKYVAQRRLLGDSFGSEYYWPSI